jgi:hypothetical protein
MNSTHKTTRVTTRKPASSEADSDHGNMDYEKEIRPLIMVSRAAFLTQDPGIGYDSWRREEVFAAVGRLGLSKCDHEHFCDLMGHFLTAAGKEDQALEWYLKGSKNPERQIAWSIAKILSDHIALAHSSVEALMESTPPRKLKSLLAARAAILDHPEGPLNFGDMLTIVRGKTRRPTLTLDADLAVSLAARCDKLQLALIRFTLVNRRNEREGRGHTSDRNKSQKSDEAKARRSPHELSDR